MNCKTGDIAVIKAGLGLYSGHLVTVEQLAGEHPRYPRLGVMWFVRPIGFAPFDCTLNERGLFLLPDGLLRPIRDPGDDAVDEMVLRAGRPDGVAA